MYNNILGIIVGYSPIAQFLMMDNETLEKVINKMSGVEFWKIIGKCKKHGVLSYVQERFPESKYKWNFIPLSCTIGDEEYFKRNFIIHKSANIVYNWNDLEDFFMMCIYCNEHKMAKYIISLITSLRIGHSSHLRVLFKNKRTFGISKYLNNLDRKTRIMKALLIREIEFFCAKKSMTFLEVFCLLHQRRRLYDEDMKRTLSYVEPPQLRIVDVLDVIHGSGIRT